MKQVLTVYICAACLTYELGWVIHKTLYYITDIPFIQMGRIHYESLNVINYLSAL